MQRVSHLRLAAALLFSLAACTSAENNDGDHIDRDRCEQVREHLIDLRVSRARRFPSIQDLPAPSSRARAGKAGPVSPTLAVSAEIIASPVDVEAHRRAMREALGDFVGDCQKSLTAAQARCVLDAKDTGAASACSRPPNPVVAPQTASN